ncbi:methyltransferase [Sulfodiicoccus acidiphilus]|uniref:Methyltransferase n=1 Tax=Sulfodiicoccus acidiphilus TaxID=1670455 RepID=A0A348B1N7_9CREN|nr:methyltransferase domain-containing protein [Sulfodiicoccus acidiphilus]BBD72089.1 methyltransferase [Sulfodiicoccus acidiphilus]GGU05071.1 methyltransferase [Sulfodiicoccus acidiphilus]
MTLCAKVSRRDYENVKGRLKREAKFLPFVEGDYIYVPVSEPFGQVVECSPPQRENRRLSSLFPGVRGYYVVGHAAVIKHREGIDLENVAKFIAATNRRVKSVFLKEKVEGEYRVNKLRLVWGEDNSVVKFRENGLTFQVDLREVFVDPSMAQVRAEMGRNLKGGRVLDVFAGYGATSLHLAREGTQVVAGDLNPEAVKWALWNAKLNKLLHKVDVIRYDGHSLPFRDGAFEKCVADNPTSLWEFEEEICRVCKSVIGLALAESPPKGWKVINEYSKELSIFQGPLGCSKEGHQSLSAP